MAIPGLMIIGETINDSVPSTRELFEKNDVDGILALARLQDEKGADYIDVNIGPRPPEFMADLVRRIQQVTTKPLSLDTPDLAIARAGLEAYNYEIAGGKRPVLNSISPLRLAMFELAKIQPFMPILLASERVVEGRSVACHTAEETYAAARELVAEAHKAGITNGDCIIDPGIFPLGSDAEGNLKRLLRAMEMIHHDPELGGIHMSVGLSNFTVMLPSKRACGDPVKGPLENAFLTKAIPLGLDMIIGSVKRKYELLPADHPAMQCLEDCLKLEGYEPILRVREFYTS